jgi:hypothetical protein
MGVAIGALTIGAWLVYSALKGQSLAQVFTGGGVTLDPAGSITAPATNGTASDGTGDTSGATSVNRGGMVAEMDRMISLRKPYRWGGGHASFSENGPWDCSGAVSWLMHSQGWLNGSPLVSTGFMRWGSPGRGSDFTVYANPTHVFIKMESGSHAGQCWGTTHSAPGGGVGWHQHTTAGFVARHHN